MGEAVGTAGGRRERRGVKDSCLGRGRGGAVGIFVVEEDDAGVEEGEAEGPEEGGNGAGGEEVVDVDVDGGFGGGGFAGVEGGAFGWFGAGGAGRGRHDCEGYGKSRERIRRKDVAGGVPQQDSGKGFECQRRNVSARSCARGWRTWRLLQRVLL